MDAQAMIAERSFEASTHIRQVAHYSVAPNLNGYMQDVP